MQLYREFWNYILFGNEWIGPRSDERYWLTLAVASCAFFVFGSAAIRVRVLPIVVTAVIAALYVIAIVPFIVWTVSCSDCDGSFGVPVARSRELILIQQYWGSIFSTSLAMFWVGAVTALSVRYGSSLLHHRLEDDAEAVAPDMFESPTSNP